MRLSIDAAPPDDRFGLLQEGFVSGGYRVTPGKIPEGEVLRAAADVCAAGGFVLSSMATNLLDLTRTRSNIAGDRSDWFVMYRPKGGLQRYDFGGREMLLRPGDIGLGTREGLFSGESLSGLAFDLIVAPAGLVRPLFDRRGFDGVRHVDSRDPMAGILAAAMDAARVGFENLSDPLAEGVLRNICALGALAAGASEEGLEVGRAAARTQRLEAAKQCIERRLDDPDLSAADVASALKVSPRTLHALFEPGGESVARYMLRRRLARVRAALARPEAPSIAELAFASGFNSIATFNRAFLHQYGCSPSDARAEALLSANEANL